MDFWVYSSEFFIGGVCDEPRGNTSNGLVSGRYDEGMVMARRAHPGCEIRLQEVIRPAGVFARQTCGTDAHVKVGTLGSRLLLDRRGSVG
jgi:hypothetical protein